MPIESPDVTTYQADPGLAAEWRSSRMIKAMLACLIMLPVGIYLLIKLAKCPLKPGSPVLVVAPDSISGWDTSTTAPTWRTISRDSVKESKLIWDINLGFVTSQGYIEFTLETLRPESRLAVAAQLSSTISPCP